ncbi:D-aminopeptidase [Hathewaya limosa]|uniref:D-aminopeptidase n=1 Tax=Hathewaya limosa TaxID=1536 RepID=A0ABU0JX52_HATLI|nr:D-aminopeptidase [Hathewaya limosa]
MPYTKRVDGRTILFTHDNFKVVFDAIMAMITLSYSAN